MRLIKFNVNAYLIVKLLTLDKLATSLHVFVQQAVNFIC